MLKLRAAALVVVLVAAVNAGAVEQRVADAWGAKLATTSQLLKDHAYAKALPILRGLTSEILDTLGPSDETTYVLAVPLIQTALAEAGSGDRAAALWHWHMAQTLYPKTAESDLSMFGEPGEFLKQNLLADPRPSSCLEQKRGPGIKPPRIATMTRPTYPEGARHFRSSGSLKLAVIIGADGLLHTPRMVEPVPTPLAYAALEAVRHWTFEPGTLDGKPVDTNFCLTVNFKLD